MWQKRLKISLLIVSDLLIFYIALWLTLLIRYIIIKRDPSTLLNSIPLHLIPFSILFALWLIVFWAAGLYDLLKLKNEKLFYRNLIITFGVNTAIAISFFYFIPYFIITPKISLFIDLGLTLAILYFWRQHFNRWVSEALKIKVVFLGASPEIMELKEFLGNNPQLGYQIVGVLAPDNTAELDNLWQNRSFSIIVSAEQFDRSKKLAFSLFKYFKKGVIISNLSKFYENVTDRVPISIIQEVWFLENIGQSQRKFYETIKRFLDIIGAVILGVITLVLSPLIIIAIEVSYPGTIFYRQQRVGQGGKIFTLIKFRSLANNKSDREMRRPYAEEITQIGKFLRKTHIDEMPQFWNILLGQMSFIGPRPEKPDLVAKLSAEIPFYEMRHLIKPGAAGWAQLYNPNAGPTLQETLEKLQYDLFYIKNRSIFLDFSITLKTIRILLSGNGK
ncbi:MAG: sugar transferase [Candidatus Azambacteria bacterium]|nr:sugar transferase [Candidatus Azambacteria bacterium]